MPWSYSENPSSSAKDAVRYRIGDTDPADPLLSDEAVLFELAEAGGDVRTASVRACRAIAGKFARQIDTSDLGTSVKLSQRRDGYLELAKSMEAETASASTPAPVPVPFAGGISGGAEDTPEGRPQFRVGMHDNHHAT